MFFFLVFSFAFSLPVFLWRGACAWFVSIAWQSCLQGCRLFSLCLSVRSYTEEMKKIRTRHKSKGYSCTITYIEFESISFESIVGFICLPVHRFCLWRCIITSDVTVFVRIGWLRDDTHATISTRASNAACVEQHSSTCYDPRCGRREESSTRRGRWVCRPSLWGGDIETHGYCF